MKWYEKLEPVFNWALITKDLRREKSAAGRRGGCFGGVPW